MNAPKYRVVSPYGVAISVHRTLSGAMRSLRGQQAGARRQGGWSEASVEVADAAAWGGWRPVTEEEYRLAGFSDEEGLEA